MQSGIGRRRESAIAQEKQNLHAGHRQRLKKRFDAVGLKGFEEHTLLELLLFYAIPQKDTNALAHELIRRFGSLDGVLQASMAQLMQVNGVGENAARMLKVVAAVCQSCGQGLWEDKRPVLASTIERGEYLRTRLLGSAQERLLLLNLDAVNTLICCEELSSGSLAQVSVGAGEVAQFCVRRGFERVILAHNHPSGLDCPSREDVAMTRKLQDLLQDLGVFLVDHFVITDRAFYSMKDHGLF